MKPAMLRTALIEDLNELACAEAQERYASDPSRARDALDRLRFLDLSELARCSREGWLSTAEVNLIERLASFARSRLGPIPTSVDAVVFTRADADWQAVRERARDLLIALDAFVDLGVAGWGHQYPRA